MFRTIPLVIAVFVIAGCASSQQPSAVNQLQIKVAQLERKVEEKDQEISDLRDSMDQMSSSQTSMDDMVIPAASIDDSLEASSVRSGNDGEIIRVAASTRDVQTALKNAGYYEGAIDGKVGQRTKQAIAKFQQDNNLKSDGIVGKKTWSELKAHLE